MGEAANDADSALVGTALRDGRYAVSAVIGRGSQGATLEAVDKREGRLVAIKRFQVRGARSWKDVELAEREARVLAGLSHRLIPKVLDHFEENGALYLVMEKIEGPTLAEVGTLSREELLRFLSDANELLEYLHGKNPAVIHRDIKPGNVIRRPARPELDEKHESYVLVDFGSVRAHLDAKGGSTVVGTFGYMAPEQLQGRALPATDVYAVGATALRMLTGVEPEHLPHRGLAIDVAAALGERDTRLWRALSAMIDPDPDKRAWRIGGLLASQPAPKPRKGPRSRKQQRRERRKQRRAEPVREHDQEGWPPVPGAFAALGLSIANLAVSVVLRFVVPLVLSLLSLVFGKGLLRAAEAVNGAGRRAQLAIGRARRRVRGRSAADATRGRVEPRGQSRIDAFEGDVDSALSEIEQAVDEVAEDVEQELERRRGKRP